MTTYETLSLLVQFGILHITNVTLTATIVVYLIIKK
ncbi:putative holin-like toxin [Virgibacillus natechei]